MDCDDIEVEVRNEPSGMVSCSIFVLCFFVCAVVCCVVLGIHARVYECMHCQRSMPEYVCHLDIWEP